MRFEAELDRAALTVALDVRHPLAFLALGPAIEFGRDVGVEINWLPVTGQVLNAPSAPSSDDDRRIRHKRHRAHMIGREIAIYAEAQGLTISDPYRDGPRDAAHLGWLWMRAHARASLEPFLEDLFREYWSLNLEPNRPDAVAKLVSTHGGDAEAFLTWSAADGPTVGAEIADALTEVGIIQAPSYLIADELFIGRQHLPLIRRLLRR